MGAETPPVEKGRRSGVMTAGALGSLAAGLAAGLAAHAWGVSFSEPAAAAVEPLGLLWANALRMTVIPLVISNLIVGVASAQGAGRVGRLGGLSLLVFLALHVLAASFTLLVAPPVLAGLRPDAAVVETLRAGVGDTPAGASAAEKAPSSAEWLTEIVPANPFKAASDGAILPVVVFIVLFALALNHAQPEHRRPILNFFKAVNEVMLILVRWILWLSPVGVFALTFSFAARAGGAAAGSLVYFVMLVCGLLLTFTLALYGVVAFIGRVPPHRFARAAAPAQVVAVSSRSSLVSLPAMLEGAQRRLRLSPAVAGFVLPLSVSVFKANRMISSTTKFLFLAALYGITLSPAQVASFLLLCLLLSFSTPGLPAVGTMRTLPAYLAAGIPIEAVVIVDAADAITDIFNTLLNVTGHMASAAVVARFEGGSATTPTALAPVAGD